MTELVQAGRPGRAGDPGAAAGRGHQPRHGRPRRPGRHEPGGLPASSPRPSGPWPPASDGGARSSTGAARGPTPPMQGPLNGRVGDRREDARRCPQPRPGRARPPRRAAAAQPVPARAPGPRPAVRSLSRRIAEVCFLSLNTVPRTHVQNVLVKLGVHSKLEAAALAVRQGLVRIGPSGLGAPSRGLEVVVRGCRPGPIVTQVPQGAPAGCPPRPQRRAGRPRPQARGLRPGPGGQAGASVRDRVLAMGGGPSSRAGPTSCRSPECSRTGRRRRRSARGRGPPPGGEALAPHPEVGPAVEAARRPVLDTNRPTPTSASPRRPTRPRSRPRSPARRRARTAAPAARTGRRRPAPGRPTDPRGGPPPGRDLGPVAGHRPVDDPPQQAGPSHPVDPVGPGRRQLGERTGPGGRGPGPAGPAARPAAASSRGRRQLDTVATRSRTVTTGRWLRHLGQGMEAQPPCVSWSPGHGRSLAGVGLLDDLGGHVRRQLLVVGEAAGERPPLRVMERRSMA